MIGTEFTVEGTVSNTEPSSALTFSFPIPEPPLPPDVVVAGVDSHPFWQVIILLVVFLNLKFHLPHRACSVILKVLKAIFQSLGAFKRDHSPALTLNTTFKLLGLVDDFPILPMCRTCHRVYPADSASDSTCSHCETNLFKEIRRLAENFDGSNAPVQAFSMDPWLKMPLSVLSMQIPEFVNRRGMEENLEAWMDAPTEPGLVRDVCDGEIWKTLKGPDGKLFFDRTPHPEDSDEPPELRIAVTVGFDG